MKKRKTHYATMRLVFDDAVTRAEALKFVHLAMPKEIRGVRRMVGPPPDRAITQHLTRFKIARIILTSPDK